MKKDPRYKSAYPYSHSMLKLEEIIQDCLNETGCEATQEVLGRFDTDGSPIQHGATTFFSKGQETQSISNSVRPDGCRATCISNVNRRENLLPAGTGCTNYCQWTIELIPFRTLILTPQLSSIAVLFALWRGSER